jgi:diguanylate cyclase (GGDEF)-like protein
MAVIDSNGDIVETNKTWNEFGNRNGLRQGTDDRNWNYFEVCERSDSDYAQRALEGLKEVISGDRESFRMEYPCHDEDKQRWFIMKVYPFDHSKENQDFYVVNHVDITHRRLSEEKSKRLSSIVENIPICIITLQYDFNSLFSTADNGTEAGATERLVVNDINPHAERVTGLKHTDVLGEEYESALGEIFGVDMKEKISDIVQSNVNLELDEVESGDGKFEGRTWNLKVFKPTSGFVSIVFEDVTEEVETREQLEYLATYDELTGIPNREQLITSLGEEFQRSQRYDNPLSFLILDLDNFKEINDTYGHMSGDLILDEFGDLLTERTRSSDTCGRYGGEEFGIVLTETSEEQGTEFAERLRESIESMDFELESGEIVNITVSIGLSEVKEDDEELEDVLTRADESLYQAKNAGRNRVVQWSECATD